MEIDFDNLHHAYLLIGQKEAAEQALFSVFEKAGASLKGSPDYFVFKETLLGVDDARRLSEQAIRRAFVGKKVFFISPEKLTQEAQNALLKTFEEPIANTHFFLVVREESQIIPTLRSRLLRINLEKIESERKEAKKFLSQTLKERLAFVKKFVDSEKNLPVFLDELLLELRGEGSNPPQLEKVYKLRLVSDDRGVSPRLILEHLSAVL